MKKIKATGPDELNTELLQHTGDEINTLCTNYYVKYMRLEKFQEIFDIVD